MIDNALSPRLAECLRQRGVDAIHVRELDMTCASDDTILTKAAHESRVVVSRDGDFSGLLARATLTWPSFVHLRVPGLNDPTMQSELLVDVLDRAVDDLERGAIVTVRDGRLRIRALPVFSP